MSRHRPINLELYTDQNPETTLHGLRYRTRADAQRTIRRVDQYFDRMLSDQPIPGTTGTQTRPSTYLHSRSEARRYYQTQKYYRIMGMRNRAVGMVARARHPEQMTQAIRVFDRWISKYQKTRHRDRSTPPGQSKANTAGGTVPDCCDPKLNESRGQCRRSTDGHVFDLPRKMARRDCADPAGFSARASCAPFLPCYQ